MTSTRRYLDYIGQDMWNTHSPTTFPPILHVNEDVFTLIAEELLRPKGDTDGSLTRLSLCCRRLRTLCLRTLFLRCATMSNRDTITGVPPLAIRPYVRHLTYKWSAYHAQHVDDHRPKTVVDLRTALRYLPYVRSVTFDCTTDGVHWEALKQCLSFPQVKSISFSASATFTHVPPYPNNASLTSYALEELCYPTPLIPVLPGRWEPATTLSKKMALERACLSTLVLGMHSTARTLVLPMNTAPLGAMAATDWPALHDLILDGSFFNATERSLARCMPSMFLRTPHLRHLVITAALPRDTGPGTRCCLLNHNPSPRSVLPNLCSLVVAYPDPRDPVFMIPLPHLVHLSLRDSPRHYDFIAHANMRSLWMSPILSATEALSILQRLRAPGLTTLELVYSADDADDALLAFIARSFPKLRHLELHRYRRSPDEIVNHRHIAHALSAIPTLVTLRLHLDFKDDPGEHFVEMYANNYRRLDADAIEQWPSRLADCGWDILGDMSDSCPLLECVALLHRNSMPPSTWMCLLRSRQDTRVPNDDFHDENRDTLSFALPSGMGGTIMDFES